MGAFTGTIVGLARKANNQYGQTNHVEACSADAPRSRRGPIGPGGAWAPRFGVIMSNHFKAEGGATIYRDQGHFAGIAGDDLFSNL